MNPEPKIQGKKCFPWSQRTSCSTKVPTLSLSCSSQTLKDNVVFLSPKSFLLSLYDLCLDTRTSSGKSLNEEFSILLSLLYLGNLFFPQVLRYVFIHCPLEMDDILRLVIYTPIFYQLPTIWNTHLPTDYFLFYKWVESPLNVFFLITKMSLISSAWSVLHQLQWLQSCLAIMYGGL